MTKNKQKGVIQLKYVMIVREDEVVFVINVFPSTLKRAGGAGHSSRYYTKGKV
jgi:hypothetical protein